MALPGVQLSGVQELQLIQRLLDEAVEQHVQTHAQGAPDEMRQALAALSGNVNSKLRHCVTLAGEAPLCSPLPSSLTSPLLRPLSPPPVDDEVRALEKQLDEASQKVAQLRSSMQATLAERLAEQLAAARPQADEPAGASTENEPPAADGQQAPAHLPPSLSPQTKELQERLAAAAGKMPQLRARLEEAAGRLHRVMGVAQGALDGPPPNTVEKAVLGKKTPGPAAPQAPRNVQPLRCAALAPDTAADQQ